MTNYMKCDYTCGSYPHKTCIGGPILTTHPRLKLDMYINRTKSSLVLTLVELVHLHINKIKDGCVLESTTWEKL